MKQYLKTLSLLIMFLKLVLKLNIAIIILKKLNNIKKNYRV